MLGGADNLNGELPSYITGANNLTPLIARPWRKAGRVPWHLTPLIARLWGNAGRVPWDLPPLLPHLWSDPAMSEDWYC